MILNRGLSAFAFLVLISCSTPGPVKQTGPFRSIVHTEYGSSGYSKKSLSEYFQLLQKTSASGASILMTCMTENKISSDIDCDSYDSPSEKTLVEFITRAQNLGLQTSIRVYVDLRSGDWRALWDPSDKDRAFKQLEQVLVRYARLGQMHKVDLFVLGAELEKLTQPRFLPKWQKIISQVRSFYSGKITYGANSNISSYKMPEYLWVPFWKELDFVGIDHYPPLPQTQSPTFENFSHHHCDWLNRYQSVYPGKKLFLNEVGFPVASEGYRKPYEWKWQKHQSLDPEKQATNVRAFLTCLNTFPNAGVGVWRYMKDSAKIHYGGYDLSHKATVKALKEGFQGQ